MSDTTPREEQQRTDAAVDPRVAAGAVDRWEVTARLEASGIGDRAARSRHGVRDVFSLAATLPVGDRRARNRGGHTPVGLPDSLVRALLLLGGVATAAELLTAAGATAALVLTSGVSGWVGGQAVAAVAWSRLGAGQLDSGLRRGAALGIGVLVLAALVPMLVLTGQSDPAWGAVLSVAWTGYAASVSLLVAAGRARPALLLVAVCLAGAGLGYLLAGGAAVGLVAATLAVLGVVGMATRAVLQAGGLALPQRQDWAAAGPATLQAALLAGSVVLLMRTIPPGGAAALVIASVAGAAVTDPAITLLRWRMRTSAARVHVLRTATRHARAAAITTAGVTSAAAALAAAAVIVALRSEDADLTSTVLVAAAFTALATTSATLTSFGAPRQAVVAAALTLAFSTAVLVGPVLLAVVAFPVALGCSVGLLLRHLSDPQVFC